MYLKSAITTLCFIVITLCPSLSAAEEELRILTENLIPYNHLDEASGKPVGFSVDLVHLLLKKTGITAMNDRILVLPWARAYKLAQKKKNTLLFTMVRTSQREALFKWVGPVAPRSIWLWKLKERTDVVVKTLEDAKQYKIGGPIGHAATQYVEELGGKVVYAPSQKLVTEMLSRHRTDLITGTDLIAAYTMKQLGRRFDELEKLILIDNRHAYYLALNLHTPDHIVRRLQVALDQAKTTGEYDAIKRGYF